MCFIVCASRGRVSTSAEVLYMCLPVTVPVHVCVCLPVLACACVCVFVCVFIVPVQLSDVKLLASLTGFVVVALPVKLLSLGT